MLYVHGNADTIVDYRFGQGAYDHTPPPRFLLTILVGDHGTPYTGDTRNPQAKVVVDATLDFFGFYLGDVADLRRLRGDADVAGVSRLASES